MKTKLITIKNYFQNTAYKYNFCPDKLYIYIYYIQSLLS